MTAQWCALVLAAGRGPDDVMAKAYRVRNKATIPIGGIPMLTRVATALRQSGVVKSLSIAIEDAELVNGIVAEPVTILPPAHSAPASVIAALSSGKLAYPVLVTTGDHALLTPDMVRHFCRESLAMDADITVGLATAETIMTAYPDSVRTFSGSAPTKSRAAISSRSRVRAPCACSTAGNTWNRCARSRGAWWPPSGSGRCCASQRDSSISSRPFRRSRAGWTCWPGR